MKYKITLKKSLIGRLEDQQRTIAALGLRKIGQSTIKPANDAVRGMIFKVKHMVSVEEIEE